MITRRFLLASGTALVTFPVAAEERIVPFRVGALLIGGEVPVWSRAFFEEMEKLGYIRGKNFSFEALSASGEGKRLPDLAAEFLARRPDVIFVQSVAAMMALANQHTTIPVVFVIGADPVGTGVVQSLAHPGGYFTGLFNNGIDHLPKNLQLLRELLPQARRVAFLVDPTFGPKLIRQYHDMMTAAASELNFEPKFFEVNSGEELPSAFDKMAEFKADAFFCTGGALWGKNRLSIIELARTHRLPAIYLWRLDVADGGLISYGSDMEGQFRSAAHHVDKILQGANPAELPVEQATRFKLVINLKTARELGLEIPWLLLTNADELIE